MEKKLKDLQDLLYARMQEANIDKDANLSLKAEIRVNVKLYIHYA